MVSMVPINILLKHLYKSKKANTAIKVSHECSDHHGWISASEALSYETSEDNFYSKAMAVRSTGVRPHWIICPQTLISLRYIFLLLYR